MNSKIGGLISFLCVALIPATFALRGNSWQKRFDRAFLQVDGVTPQGRIRSLQRALRDPKLRTDVSKAIDIVREKGFGKGHPEFIEILWPEGTQARRDLEGINALTKQLQERRNELQESASETNGLIDVIQSTQESVRFGEEGSRAVVSSLLKRVESDPSRAQRLVENLLRNAPVEIESPSYKVLGKYFEDDSKNDEAGDTDTGKKSFLTVPPLELRQYDAFRSVSVPLKPSGTLSSSNKIYTLKNMGSALTEIFSYLELGNNDGSIMMSMTTPFFISDTVADGTQNMFLKLPEKHEVDPPKPVTSSSISFDDIPETAMATLSFSGICTDEEIERQKAKLLERVEKAGNIGWKIRNQGNIDSKSDDLENEGFEEDSTEASKPEFFVLQYNAPGTLPWRRMNEIAVVMEKATLTKDQDENVTESEINIDQSDSLSSNEGGEEGSSGDDDTQNENTPSDSKIEE